MPHCENVVNGREPSSKRRQSGRVVLLQQPASWAGKGTHGRPLHKCSVGAEAALEAVEPCVFKSLYTVMVGLKCILDSLRPFAWPTASSALRKERFVQLVVNGPPVIMHP